MVRTFSQRGFTLVELLISATLAAVVMAALLSTYIFLGRSLTRLANYQILEAQSRKTLTYLRRDLVLAKSVKTGTTPTATSVTLVLPAGEVSYTFDSSLGQLHRQANFGANPDIYLLKTDSSTCSAFTFEYYTTAEGSPTGVVTGTQYVPYSIKQIRVRFTVQTPSANSPATQVRYDTVSSRYAFRNTPVPTGN